MAARTGTWVAAAATGALLIAGGTWLLAVGPALAEASEQRQAAADQRDRNDLLALQLEGLKAEAANLDAYRAELAELRTKVPTTGELTELTRQIQSVADATGVVVTVVSPGTPTALIPAAPAVPEPSPSETAATDGAEVTADGDSTETDPAADGATPTDPSAPAGGGQAGAVEGLHAISLSITSVGGYTQTVAFIDQLQRAMPRLFAISGLNATSLDQSEASGGRPATIAGDLETILTGAVLVLDDSRDAPPVDQGGTEGTPLAPLPVPAGERNPFQPLGS